MSNTQNIFEMLSDNESGDERPQKTEKRVRTRGKKQVPSSTAADNTDNYENDAKAKKSLDTRHKRDYKKNTGVSQRNRSKDRHSGTGYSGVQRNNFRKRGHGSGNVGTVKDDIQGRAQDREEVEEAEESEEELEDNRLTVEQYFQQKGANLDSVMEGQKAEKKVGQIDEKSLKKDKLEVVQKKPELAARVDALKAKEAYKPAYQGELTELLNFRTGFVVDKKKKRAPKPEATEEGEKTEQPKEEGEQAEQPKEERRRPKNDSRNNNKRGGDRRDNRKFDNKKSSRSAKGYNVENDQDFPKLG